LSIQKPKVRSSSIPLLMACTNAVLNPDNLIRVETENETSIFGTMVHGLCQSLVETGEYNLPALKDRLSSEDYDRANIQFNNFLKAYNEARLFMPTPQAEVDFEAELSHVILTGHIDLLQLNPINAFILDYKTGRMHEDHYHQMAAYAYGAWVKAGRPGNYIVYVTTIYLEDNGIQNYTFTVGTLLDWEREVAAQVMQLRYTAGRKCSHCTLQGSCPAYRTWAGGATAIFTGDVAVPARTWADMTPAERGELVDKMYVVEKAIERVKSGLRNLVRSKGAVDVGDGKEYVLVESTEQRLDAAKSMPILLKVLGKERVYPNSQLSLNAILTEYASRAARGQKTTARKELYDALDAAGAIVRVKETKMWRRPIGEKTLET
jgi:hypothetical protein